MHTTSIVQAPSLTLASGITIPDSKMAREVTELVRAAHSNAEPRASSKDLARWRLCRLPFPSAVLRSTERLARSSCSVNARRLVTYGRVLYFNCPIRRLRYNESSGISRDLCKTSFLTGGWHLPRRLTGERDQV